MMMIVKKATKIIEIKEYSITQILKIWIKILTLVLEKKIIYLNIQREM